MCMETQICTDGVGRELVNNYEDCFYEADRISDPSKCAFWVPKNTSQQDQMGPSAVPTFFDTGMCCVCICLCVCMRVCVSELR